MPVVKSIYVEKFRKLEKIEIPIGKMMTVISGQNGTMKSTILGMLGQPFGWTANKTVHGRDFKAKFSESFKWSPTYDIPKTHKYYINFVSDEIFGKEREVIASFDRPGANPPIRLVTGDTRSAGDGNIDFPVIYLSLKRVVPIGSFVRISETESTLTQAEEKEFIQDYNDLMLSCNEIILSSVTTQSSGKQTIAASSAEHDGLTISAGQDNLGQILGAIISFSRLKKELGNEYKGGLLLIDEVDATLHASVCEKLIKYLYKKSKALNLQVVFTTHNLEIINLVQTHYAKQPDDCTVLYFKRDPNSEISFSVDMKYDEIIADMTAETLPKPESPVKIDVFCEDDEAKLFAKQILKGTYLKLANIVSVELGCGELKNMAASKAYVFKQTIFCLDGDTKFGSKELKTSGKPIRENIVLLPGSPALSPELLFCNYLDRLPADDKFFTASTNGYSKQVFLHHHPPHKYDRDEYKRWFREECKRWGDPNGFPRLFKRWSLDEENQKSLDKFLANFKSSYNLAAKEKQTPLI